MENFCVISTWKYPRGKFPRVFYLVNSTSCQRGKFLHHFHMKISTQDFFLRVFYIKVFTWKMSTCILCDKFNLLLVWKISASNFPCFFYMEVTTWKIFTYILHFYLFSTRTISISFLRRNLYVHSTLIHVENFYMYSISLFLVLFHLKNFSCLFLSFFHIENFYLYSTSKCPHEKVPRVFYQKISKKFFYILFACTNVHLYI